MADLPVKREEPASPAQRPSVVAPSTRVNVALPFSKFELREMSRESVELVALVADLIAALEVVTPSEKLAGLRERADALVARCA